MINKAACSVSPVIYLYRIGALDWLPKLFGEVWMPTVVLEDLLEARFIGYDVPSPFDLPWVQYEDPELTVPSAWMSLDLSSGEVAAMSLAFENRDCVVLLDDPLARNAARNVGIQYWGTIKIMLEAKQHGLTDKITPYVDKLARSSLLLSEENRRRILALAGEDGSSEKPPETKTPLEKKLAAEASHAAAPVENTPPVSAPKESPDAGN